MKKFLLFVLLFPTLGFAAVVHSIIIGDTLDKTVGKAVKIDIPKICAHSKKIAAYTGLELQETIIIGSEVTLKNILNTLESLQFKEDDAVLLYYSGHGYRTDRQESRWPNISPPGFKGMNLEFIAGILINKNPRLLLILADVCNNVIPEDYAPITLFQKGFVTEETLKKNYTKLFLETKAIIIATAALPTQFSYCDEKNGGHFTFFYLSAFNEMMKKPEEADWEQIFSKTVAKLKKQTPQYEIYPARPKTLNMD